MIPSSARSSAAPTCQAPLANLKPSFLCKVEKAFTELFFQIWSFFIQYSTKTSGSNQLTLHGQLLFTKIQGWLKFLLPSCIILKVADRDWREIKILQTKDNFNIFKFGKVWIFSRYLWKWRIFGDWKGMANLLRQMSKWGSLYIS